MKKGLIVLLHMGYWLCYALLLFGIMAMLHHSQPSLMGPHARLRAIFIIFTTIPALLGFYLFYTFVFAQYRQRGKLLGGALVALASLVVAAVVSGGVVSLFVGAKTMFADGWQSYFEETLVLGLLALIHGIVALVLHGFIVWLAESKLQAELKEKNYSMELALVKAQIHPHFLFNTLNNIDVLVEKDPPLASNYLNKLSAIMRFMLYETKPDTIALDKELSYIEAYIDLQRLRAAHPDYVKYDVRGAVHSGAQVPPMLFIPFIENAFKFSEGHKSEPAISILFDIKTGTLDFVCENKYSAFGAAPMQGGTGLSLIKKRLQLLYPNKHTLQIANRLGLYRVHLRLEA